MRVRFAKGKVVETLSDGRELKLPVDSAKGDVALLAKSVLRVDRQRRNARYFSPGKTASEISKEWNDSKP